MRHAAGQWWRAQAVFTFGKGFWADRRATYWAEDILTPGDFSDQVSGAIYCAPGTDIWSRVQYASGVTAWSRGDIADYYLCSNRTS